MIVCTVHTLNPRLTRIIILPLSFPFHATPRLPAFSPTPQTPRSLRSGSAEGARVENTPFDPNTSFSSLRLNCATRYPIRRGAKTEIIGQHLQKYQTDLIHMGGPKSPPKNSVTIRRNVLSSNKYVVISHPPPFSHLKPFPTAPSKRHQKPALYPMEGVYISMAQTKTHLPMSFK